MTARQITVPELHTEGAQLRLDLVDDNAAINCKRWRIVLDHGTLQVVLLDDMGNDYQTLRIKRIGTQYDVVRGGEAL